MSQITIIYTQLTPNQKFKFAKIVSPINTASLYKEFLIETFNYLKSDPSTLQALNKFINLGFIHNSQISFSSKIKKLFIRENALQSIFFQASFREINSFIQYMNDKSIDGSDNIEALMLKFLDQIQAESNVAINADTFYKCFLSPQDDKDILLFLNELVRIKTPDRFWEPFFKDDNNVELFKNIAVSSQKIDIDELTSKSRGKFLNGLFLNAVDSSWIFDTYINLFFGGKNLKHYFTSADSVIVRKIERLQPLQIVKKFSVFNFIPIQYHNILKNASSVNINRFILRILKSPLDLARCYEILATNVNLRIESIVEDDIEFSSILATFSFVFGFQPNDDIYNCKWDFNSSIDVNDVRKILPGTLFSIEDCVQFALASQSRICWFMCISYPTKINLNDEIKRLILQESAIRLNEKEKFHEAFVNLIDPILKNEFRNSKFMPQKIRKQYASYYYSATEKEIQWFFNGIEHVSEKTPKRCSTLVAQKISLLKDLKRHIPIRRTVLYWMFYQSFVLKNTQKWGKELIFNKYLFPDYEFTLTSLLTNVPSMCFSSFVSSINNFLLKDYKISNNTSFPKKLNQQRDWMVHWITQDHTNQFDKSEFNNAFSIIVNCAFENLIFLRKPNTNQINGSLLNDSSKHLSLKKLIIADIANEDAAKENFIEFKIPDYFKIIPNLDFFSTG